MKIKVKKRNGNIVDFDSNKIKIAIEKAMKETDIGVNKDDSTKISLEALVYFKDKEIVDIEEIQDFVEFSLMKYRPDVAKKYIIYRQERKNLREKGWDMNELQKDIYNKKYKYENESFEEFLDRVSGGNSYIKKAIKDKKFMPAGRILSGRGLNKKGRKITYSNCFIAGTPVLTKDGYKPIEKVVTGDKVVTHNNRLKTVNATMVNNYNDILYEISTPGNKEPIYCTANHPFLTTNGWKKACDLSKDDYIKSGFLKKQTFNNIIFDILNYFDLDQYSQKEKYDFEIKEENEKIFLRTSFYSGNNAYSHKDSSKINRYIKIDEELLYIFGVYLANGSITKRENKSYYSIWQIVGNKKDKEKLLKMKNKIEESFGVKLNTYEPKTQETFIIRIDNPLLAEFFYHLFGDKSDTKKIPDIFKNSLDIALGVIDTDGCITNNGVYQLVLNNLTLINQVKNILELYGYLCSNIQNVNQSLGTEYTAYRLRTKIASSFLVINNTQKNKNEYNDNRLDDPKQFISTNTAIFENKELFLKIKVLRKINLNKIGANIKVYNISVEEDHSYVVDGLVVHNCYVLAKPEDSIESIFDTAKYLARTYSYGGGCGVNISNLRPCGAKVNNAAQTTTGSVSFMDLYSMVTGLIGMRGRRGALMLNMDVSHPDIENFIDVKNDLSKVVYANTSVNVDDDFMKAVKENKDYTLHFKVKATGEEITKTINAKELFKKLALNNWNMAEPGILFQDRINSWHLMSAFDNFEFAGVNPCAEEPLPAWGSCNLASINLSNFVKYPFEEDAYFDFQEFKVMVKHGVQYLNEVLDENSELHPLEMQKEVSKNLRQIGLGLMGVADMFIKMGIKYGSPASIKLIEKIGKTMINEALKASAMLAKKDGPFPMYDKEKLLNSEFLKQNANNEVIELIKKYGIRNSQLLTMAPTGSISTLIGCSNGVEPIFQISYTRKTETLNDKDTYYKVYTQIVREYMDKNNIKNEEDLPDFIITSKDLNYKDRILVQAAWQKTIDASISSTCNVPYEFTVEEVEDLYMFAWEQGLKGVTIYRDGCKRSGILISNNKKTAKEKIDELEEEIKTIANDSLKENPDVCPMCGGKMNHSGGCAECQDCGYSPCSV